MHNHLIALEFILQIIGAEKVCHASEKSEVDPTKKLMSLKTINLTFCRHISVDEVLSYSPHPTDPEKTLLRQEASVSVRGVPLSHYMESLITSSISSNAGKGRLGLEWVINKINLEVSGVIGDPFNILIVNIRFIAIAGKKYCRISYQKHRRYFESIQAIHRWHDRNGTQKYGWNQHNGKA